ncbi:MAG: DUF5020 family protein [Tannerellaceae bacterium]|jgi:hypothetical protein|nr:DUF5020 family protein [Tannerellaceae bacterium]
MKHFLFSTILSLTVLLPGSFCGKAQNVQLHYDFGSAMYNKDYGARPVLTSTVEMFKPDAWGSTFFFIDMDYTANGITGGYWEIARELRFWERPFSLHVEYNGGQTLFFSFRNAYLGGVTYTYDNKDFSKGFSVSAMYKYIRKHNEPHNFQLTGTWYLNFGRNGLCTFSGFADWWREKTDVGDFIFMAEPQFWINLNKIKGINNAFNLSVGSEVELTNNFSMLKGFYAIPTLAMKWSFN